MTKTTPENLLIRRLPYTRMLKSEMANYAENIVSIVESHNADSAIINPLLGLLLAKKPEIEMLRLSYGVDVERLKIDKIKQQMMLIISMFKLKVRMLSNSNLELDVHVIQNAINNHFCYLNRCRNDKELNQKIAGFLDLMDANIELVAALDEFNLMGDINQIKIVHNLFNDATNKRVNLLSKRPHIPTKNIIKDLFNAIDTLFKGVEVAQVINSISVTGADFTPLISELSQLSDMYYKSFSIRKANNKRKFEKKQQNDSVVNEVPIQPEHDAAKEASTPEEKFTAMSSMSNEHEDTLQKREDTLQEHEASFKELDVPLGKHPTIKLGKATTINSSMPTNTIMNSKDNLGNHPNALSKKRLLQEIGCMCRN